MPITKPAYGSTGWNTAVDAVIDFVNAASISSGVDPTDVGYDLILLLGQSNMAGWAVDGDAVRYDVTDPRVAQYGSAGTYAGVISQAVEPLAMHDTTTPGVGPGLHFARWYLHTVPANRRVLLIPAAHGGTPLSSIATLGWRRGVSGNLYAQALTQTQNALVAAGAHARITAALWVQGEADGDANVSGSTYQADLDALITGLRADLSLPNLPFVIGQMVPDYLGFGTRAAIDAVQAATPNRIGYVGYAPGPTGKNRGDSNHYNAAGYRVLARSMFNAYLSALTSGATPTLTNVTAPTISGSTTTGQTLTASNGTWSTTPDSYSYQWKRAGSAISGATAATYVLQVADEGQAITVTVTASKSGYTSGTATSASVTPSSGSGGTLTNTVLPAISGTASMGQTLTTSNGTWSATPDSYTYQWKRAGSAISGATSSTYGVQAADVGQAVTVTVTAIKATYTSGVATSASVTPTAGTLTNSTAPTITGTATVGQTLTAGNGTWSATPDSYTYQWKRSGSNISGATSSTYLLVTTDIGNTITVTVTAVKAGYTSASATSAATGTVAAAGASVTDSFTRANSTTIGTTETGGLTWATSGTGTWDIVSNKLRCTSPNTSTGSQCVVNTGSADGTFSTVLSSFSGALAGFTLRCAVDNTSAAYVAFRNFAGKFELMSRAAGGGFTTIATSSGDVVAGDTLSVTLSGSSIIGKINGVTAWSATNTTVTAGTRHGYFVYGSGTDTAQFDDFSAGT